MPHGSKDRTMQTVVQVKKPLEFCRRVLAWWRVKFQVFYSLVSIITFKTLILLCECDQTANDSSQQYMYIV